MLQLREKEIFETLKDIKKFNFVIIGGYAVNAYTLPRFSVDCDLVVKDSYQLKEIEDELLKRKYIKTETENIKLPYHGKFLRYEKLLDKGFKASMDILFSEVLDRQTGVKFDADWIIRNSSQKYLRGKTINEDIKINVINLDALIVMKLISCRSTDIRDVFMLIPKAENIKWIKEEISKIYNFKDRFNKFKEKVFSKEFKDNIQGVYGFVDEKTFDRHKKAILDFEK